jgi:hypothetical protein
MAFWVVGGEYSDTRFAEIVGGGAETRLGPFADYEEARAEWARRAWASVDDATVRWRLEEEGGEEASAYWVVGGEYADTGFTQPAPGTQEQRYGPFQTYEDAKAEWARRAWATVDDAHTRFRIERRAR